MSDLEREIEHLENTITEYKKLIDRRDVLQRLMDNSDYKTIIEKDYLQNERIRLGGLVGSPNPSIEREHIITDLAGTAALQRYLFNVIQMGDMAVDQVDQAEEEILSLREELAATLSGEFEEEAV